MDSCKLLIAIKEYFLITVGLMLYILAWSVFLLPNNLVGGGVSGISALIFYVSKGAVGMGTSYFIINGVLLILAFKILGGGFGWKTIYAILFCSVMLNYVPTIIPQTFIEEFSVSNGKMLCALFGAVMVGIGIGLSFSQGGSTGGTDIVALIMNKYWNVAPGKVMFALDFLIISSVLICPTYDSTGALVPLSGRMATAAYGYLACLLSNTVLDFYLQGTRQSIQLLIFSKKFDQIADVVAYKVGRGVSVLDVEGWYTKEHNKAVLVMARKSDLNEMMKYIKAIDPDAFISVSSVMGVYGCGFDQYRVKKSFAAKKKD